MNAKLVTVTHCIECPFADSPDSPDGRWLCTADERRWIVGVHITAISPPPTWCPLRTAKHVVALETT